MRISVGLVLFLTAASAYAAVANLTACTKALRLALKTATKGTSFIQCKSDPEGSVAWTALADNPDCKDYMFLTSKPQCEIAAAPLMKCVAGKLGYLNDDGSISGTKFISKFKSYVTSKPGCDAAQYDFGVKKCGPKITNYTFLKKAACIVLFMNEYSG
ncbi:uncharacterized protein LOC108671354 [Hyalella azteca]|uniref:Uncharacterized protein LOC108671354 n=1 Tax=Hyalella azteca TaxID=294128 RepID=A0A8B7NL32_HYAAZ|nr:uncharacterized protein LOC108671354 [Hyalella azteca]